MVPLPPNDLLAGWATCTRPPLRKRGPGSPAPSACALTDEPAAWWLHWVVASLSSVRRASPSTAGSPAPEAALLQKGQVLRAGGVPPEFPRTSFAHCHLTDVLPVKVVVFKLGCVSPGGPQQPCREYGHNRSISRFSPSTFLFPKTDPPECALALRSPSLLPSHSPLLLLFKTQAHLSPHFSLARFRAAG